VKQLDHLFDAAARLTARGVRVVVAGGPVPGYEQYSDELIRAGREKLGDRLVHLGHLEDLRGFFNAVTLFTSTSRAEGCSNSVLQALACGAPVIGYPGISVDEQVLPDGGAIVEQDRVGLLTAELDRWLADPARIARARDGARGQAQRLFDINKIADDIWGEYASLTSTAAEQVVEPAAAGVS
jgi:glycosyltransferase involved in cell wall biosynthesis